MEENEDADLFDDFFDNPGQRVNHSIDKGEKNKEETGKSSPRRSGEKLHRNGSQSGRSNMSSDHDSSATYSSDSDGDSDTDSRKRREPKSRSRSASSRSAGSYSSDDSYSSKDSRSRSSRKKGRESRSRSSSSSRSRSRTTTTDSPSRASKEKKESKRRYSYSSVTSSDDSSYSESKHSGRRSPTPTPKSKKDVHRQAWDTEAKSSNSRQDRPRSAKKRSSHDRTSAGDASRRRGRKYSDVNSDSDMTDVSPILSPRNGSVNGQSKTSGDKYKSGDKYNGSKPAMFQAMPLDRGDSGMNVHDGGDRNALDLNILMKAVSELEKQKRVKSNTRRVMFEPLRSRPKDKSNYTFSNDDTHRIDAENKRLLKQIMREVHSREERVPRAAEVKIQQATLTPSAVNRRRAQQRIENENLSFLRRLQKIKPSRGISRNEQLTAYNSTILHGIPIANLHPTRTSSRSGCHSSASSVAGSLGRTRSMTSIHSNATASSIASNSRQSSRAGSRPTSAKLSHRVPRPAWNDRW